MPSQNLIIISAGKFGREVYTWARQAIQTGTPWAIKGFLDNRAEILRAYRYEAPILGPVQDYQPASDDLFISAVAEPSIKKHYCSILEGKGATFATLIHPTSLVGHDVHVGPGCILGPFTQLSCDLRLGNHVAFGTHSSTAHDTRIGDYSQISGACQINGNAILEDLVFLGSHATILPNVRIGAGAYIGAGSVVLKRVKAGVRVFGNPAVPISEDGT